MIILYFNLNKQFYHEHQWYLANKRPRMLYDDMVNESASKCLVIYQILKMLFVDRLDWLQLQKSNY